jgi:PD-(D/E)XK nuclease superfamily protein
MRIDNSQAKMFLECPLKAFERYEQNLELTARDTEGLDFGTRWHALQAARNSDDGSETIPYSGEPLPDARLEAEVQATFQAYLQHYRSRVRDFLDVERTLVVPLNDRHELAFKIDLLTREEGGLAITDYKTEKRGGQFNTPESWAARSQVALYQWAAERHYGEPVVALYLDVTTRSSPKGQELPLFTRQRLVRTSAQREAAVRNIIWVADQIESMRVSGFWPSNTEKCRDGWRRCDYYQLHVIGRTDGNLQLYQPAKPYLDL